MMCIVRYRYHDVIYHDPATGRRVLKGFGGLRKAYAGLE
jgi:hypothetical protein